MTPLSAPRRHRHAGGNLHTVGHKNVLRVTREIDDDNRNPKMRREWWI